MRGGRVENAARMRDLLFPAWDTTMGDGYFYSHPGPQGGSAWEGKGALSPFQECALPYADPRWAGSHSACHFDALSRTGML